MQAADVVWNPEVPQRCGSQADQAGDVTATDQPPGGWCRPALGIADGGGLIAAPVDRFIAAADVQFLCFQRPSQQAQGLPVQSVTGVADAQPGVGMHPGAQLPETCQIVTGQGSHVGPSGMTGQPLGLLFTGIQHQQPGGMARAAGRWPLIPVGMLNVVQIQAVRERLRSSEAFTTLHGQVLQGADATESADPPMGLAQFRGVGVDGHGRDVREQRHLPAKDAVQQPTAQKLVHVPEIRVQCQQGRAIKHVGIGEPLLRSQEQVQGQQFRMQETGLDVLMTVGQSDHQLIGTQPKPSVSAQNLHQRRLVPGAEAVLECLFQSSGADLHTGPARVATDYGGGLLQPLGSDVELLP